MLSDVMATLEENDAVTYDGRFTLEETLAPVNEREHRSAPDNDEIKTELTNFFSDKIGHFAANTFMEAFDSFEHTLGNVWSLYWIKSMS